MLILGVSIWLHLFVEQIQLLRKYLFIERIVSYLEQILFNSTEDEDTK